MRMNDVAVVIVVTLATIAWAVVLTGIVIGFLKLMRVL